MSEDLSRLSRLISILTILQTKNLITATELSLKYDLSIRTIYRDLKALQNAGIPIYTIEGKGYSLMKNFKLPPVSFSEDQANALITAQKIIANNRDISLRTNYNEAIDKIKAVLRTELKTKTNLLEDRILVVGQNSQVNSDQLTTIQGAITNNWAFEIEYISFYKSEFSKRIIEPKALYNTRENWILIAHCQKQNDYREFRLDRIKKLVLLSNQISERPFELANYFQEKLKSFSTPDMHLSNAQRIFTSKIIKMKEIRLIGIKTRTANDGKAAIDIPALWNRYLSIDTQSALPEKLSGDIYCVYCEYDSDHLGPYTTFLGCPVSDSIEVPEGFHEQFISAGEYEKFISKGNIHQGSIVSTWHQIWGTKLNRNYKTDFELYGKNATDPTNAEVEIFVGIKA